MADENPTVMDREAAVEAVLAEMGGHIERASNRVYEWPADEADLHRNGEHRSFTERSAAVARLRAGKIVDAVLLAVAQESPRVRLEAWIEAQRAALPEGCTPVAHGKAELLRDLEGVLDDLFANIAVSVDGGTRASGREVDSVAEPHEESS